MSVKNVPIPEAAKAAGMTRLVLEDDFDNYESIDMSGEGKPGYHWYADRPYGKSTLTYDEVVIENSVLTLKPERCGAAVTLPSYSRKGQTGFTYRFGYAEAKIRFPVDNLPPAENGQIPAFWGLGVDDVAGRSWYRLGELDILEAIHPGSDLTKTIYTGTLHDHWKTPFDGKVLCTNSVNATGYQDQFDYLDGEWHVYAALWEKGHVSWYLDNKLMHSARYEEGQLPQYYYRDDPTPLPRLEDTMPTYKRLPWKGGHTIMDHDEMVLFFGGHKDWPMEIDWVRVWQE